MEVLFLLDTYQGSQNKKVESHCSYNTTAYEYKVVLLQFKGERLTGPKITRA